MANKGIMYIDGQRVPFDGEPNVLSVIRKAGIEMPRRFKEVRRLRSVYQQKKTVLPVFFWYKPDLVFPSITM